MISIRVCSNPEEIYGTFLILSITDGGAEFISLCRAGSAGIDQELSRRTLGRLLSHLVLLTFHFLLFNPHPAPSPIASHHFDEPIPVGIDEKVLSTDHVEFAEDVGEVVPDRNLTDAELAGDVFVF